MSQAQEIKDTAKEVITILTYFEPNSLEKIPNSFLENLMLLAANSNCNFQIDTNKNLLEQNISEESKDLLALIYYSYFADNKEKNNLLEKWKKNDELYQKELVEKYNPNNLFSNKQYNTVPHIKDTQETAIIKHNKTFLFKIFNKIRNILRANRP